MASWLGWNKPGKVNIFWKTTSGNRSRCRWWRYSTLHDRPLGNNISGRVSHYFVSMRRSWYIFLELYQARLRQRVLEKMELVTKTKTSVAKLKKHGTIFAKILPLQQRRVFGIQSWLSSPKGYYKEGALRYLWNELVNETMESGTDVLSPRRQLELLLSLDRQRRCLKDYSCHTSWTFLWCVSTHRATQLLRDVSNISECHSGLCETSDCYHVNEKFNYIFEITGRTIGRQGLLILDLRTMQKLHFFFKKRIVFWESAD